MQCPNCFREVNTSGACPFCGYDPTGAELRFPLALRPGSILNGRYIVGRVLGQGGFGITYIALDDRTGERVAIKEYLPSEFAVRYPGSPSVQVHSANQKENFAYGKAQFLEEAKTLAAFIGNAGIVRIDSYFEENGTAYFCMEYVDGLPLDKYMAARGGRLTPAEADRLLLPLMESLETVHAKGIVHRDIAPDNILVTKEGQAKLIDFGAARYSTGEKSRSLDVILKHGFAPVEQYTRRGRQGPWTDVYALAATYYFAITGKVLPESVDRMQEDELLKPSALGVKLSPDQEGVLLKALVVSASGRFQSMEAFRRAMYEASPAAKAEAERRERALREELARLERERLAREQAEREKREKAEREERERKELAVREEAERRRREEEARKAREKAEREERESKKREAKAEAERLKREEKERCAREKAALREAKKRAQKTEGQTKPAGGDKPKKPKLPLILGAVAVLAAVLFLVFGSNGQPEAPAVTVEPMTTEAPVVTETAAPETPAPTSEETPESPVSGTTEDGFKYDLYTDHAVITKYFDKYFDSGDRHAFAIPGEIEGKPVTAIGNYAFDGCSSLTSITIPDGVTSIGEWAFSDCNGLTSITIPDGVTSIGEWAFCTCEGLTEIVIPESVTSIGDKAFYGCSGLTSITIPEGVTSIGSSTFVNCTSLTSITIPGSVASIGSNAFEYCIALTSITIPDGVTSIGRSAFMNCKALTELTLPESIASIGSYAFTLSCPISQINYAGTDDQWNAINISDGNFALTRNKVRFQTQQ